MMMIRKTNKKIGVLLTNIGTPSAPTVSAVRTYLREFLSDQRVVELPRLIWYPILYGIILPLRAFQSAKLYKNIWQPDGSPLLVNSQKIADALEAKTGMPVVLGMHYGQPSMQKALEKLRAEKVERIIVLPLYPQNSATTTASSFDCLAKVFKTWRALPDIQFIADYADHPAYIESLCESICQTWQTHGKKFLLFSFHGIPRKYINKGDPYEARCYQTVTLIKEKLGLSDSDYCISFQSRLGRTEWLKPYTDEVLEELPKKNIKAIQVICPGFAADCLETLEEIALRGEEQFKEGGGEDFHYIPALNATAAHITALEAILKCHLSSK